MTLLDGPIRKVAKTVIDRFGTDVTLRAIGRSTYNVTNGASTQTPTDSPLKGILSEYNAYEIGDTIKAGDRKLEIAASALSSAPTTGDQVLVGNGLYRIVRIRIHMSGDQAALYELQLRGGP